MPGRILVRIRGFRVWDPVLGRVWRGVYLLWVRFQHPVPVMKGFGGPTATVTRTHSLSRWAHIVDLGARIQLARAWESEIRWLGVEGVVVEM